MLIMFAVLACSALPAGTSDDGESADFVTGTDLAAYVADGQCSAGESVSIDCPGLEDSAAYTVEECDATNACRLAESYRREGDVIVATCVSSGGVEIVVRWAAPL